MFQFSSRAAAMCVFALSSSALFSAAHAQKMTLNYASPLPANHAINKVIEPWLQSLTTASNGDIEVKWYPGEVIAKSTKALASVKDGLVDGSYVIDSYTSSELPHQITASKNGAFGEDSMVMTGAANEYMLLNCEECKQDWLKNGVMAMAYASTSTYNLACREQLDTTEKLANRKIRGAGSFGVMTKELGGVPVNIPISETYEALQRGQADCTFAAEAHLKAYSFNEVVKYMITAPFGVYMSGSLFTLNKDKWAAMPAKHKQLILSKLPELITNASEAYDDEAKVSRKESETKGVKWVPPGKGILEARASYLAKVIDVAEEEGKKRRLQGVREMMMRFPPIHEKWKKIVADIGHDKTKFQEALQREIYSKVKF